MDAGAGFADLARQLRGRIVGSRISGSTAIGREHLRANPVLVYEQIAVAFGERQGDPARQGEAVLLAHLVHRVHEVIDATLEPQKRRRTRGKSMDAFATVSRATPRVRDPSSVTERHRAVAGELHQRRRALQLGVLDQLAGVEASLVEAVSQSLAT